ncbi:MAG: N-acetyltransferase, partial [Bauldia sp.]|nr:N-acetyltransferase [Bauldia sp.]
MGSHALYGRYWGAVEEQPFLHFELCYYQAIEWGIA